MKTFIIAMAARGGVVGRSRWRNPVEQRECERQTAFDAWWRLVRYGSQQHLSATKCNKKRSLLKEINESYKRKTLRFQQHELTVGEVLRVVGNCLNLIFVFYLKFN